MLPGAIPFQDGPGQFAGRVRHRPHAGLLRDRQVVDQQVPFAPVEKPNAISVRRPNRRLAKGGHRRTRGKAAAQAQLGAPLQERAAPDA